jgi:phosphoribosylaminoimidazolecarboxamide formyltransferase/IMP cyclohydrolase
LSVADKTGIVDFAAGLADLEYELVSTGGTRRVLEEAGLEVTGIDEVTGFPEILDGRVKTLHPAAFAGILADRSNPGHMSELADHGLRTFNVIAVNFYPFEQTITENELVTEKQALENIDIGGPSLLRAAAKNLPHVLPVPDPQDYDRVLAALREGGEYHELARTLAIKVFRHTAFYDGLIADFLNRLAAETAEEGVDQEESFAGEFAPVFRRIAALRYGENPHQAGAVYREPLAEPGSLAAAEQLGGKDLSFNNYNDAEAGLALVKEFGTTACVALKHTSPCGVALADTPAEAFRRARQADPVSIFGGVVAFNRCVDLETAEELTDLFLEIVLAPAFDDEALELLRNKKKNLRLLQIDLSGKTADRSPSFDLKRISGGLLVQEPDILQEDVGDWEVVSAASPTDAEYRDLMFAWKVVKHTKSNAIVVAKNGVTTGIGPGQPNRVDAAKLAVERAGEEAQGSVMASDAFIPFGDTIEVAAEAGVTAVVEPGGSIRDDECVEAADEAGIALLFTGIRHFKH